MPGSLTLNGGRTISYVRETYLIEGAEVSYTCDNDYLLSLEQSTSTCTSVGSWDPPIDNPMCYPSNAVV